MQRDVGPTLSATQEAGAPPPEASAADFAAGQTVAERYRVIRFIGRGGMGEVYEVEDLLASVHVALKALRAHLVGNDAAVERLRRELTLARRVTHANVCRLFDLGVHGNIPFLTMELLDGETLSDRLKRGPLAGDEALAVARGLAAALDAAHAAQVLHRDFKSGNVMLVRDGRGARPVVTDFGLARAEAPDEDTRVTREGGLVGTPAYMAPEQVEGGAITARSDVYAFGVVLFELTTGTLPFEASTPLAAAAARVRRAPPSPRARTPAIDARWDAAIRRCLAPEAADRFASAGAAVAAMTAGRVRRWATPAALAMLAAGLAAAAIAVAVERRSSRSPTLISPAAPATRRSVAVVGSAPDVVERLRAELGGDRLRLVPGENTDQIVGELGMSGADLGSASSCALLAHPAMYPSLATRVARLRAEVAWARGADDDARAAYTAALDLARGVGDRRGLTRILVSSATFELERGRLDEARGRAHEALAIMTPLGYRLSAARAGLVLAEVGLREGRAADAEREASAARAVLAEVHALDDEAWAAALVAAAVAAQGRADEARTLRASLAQRTIATAGVRRRVLALAEAP